MTERNLNCARTSLTVLKASGTSIKDYLQGQITQDIKLLDTQASIYTAILSPQAKMIADAYITEAHGDIFLISQSFCAQNLLHRLQRFSLGHDIHIEICDDIGVLSLQGKQAEISKNNITQTVYSSIAISETCANIGYWLLMKQTDIEQALQTMPDICEQSSMQQARIIKGLPCFGIDWDISTHPLLANLIELHGVNFDKGCYVGQEVTSRMHWRGGIKKRLYQVRIEGALPQTPCPIQTTINIGMLTSATSLSPDIHQGIAHLSIETAESNKPLRLENGSSLSILGICHD